MTRRLTEDEVEFDVECWPEEVSIEDGLCDHEGCEECHRWIYDQLEGGNEWAWCTVRVTARWNEFEGNDCLGCCSYESEEDFMREGGYYSDMKKTALDNLNDVIRQSAERLLPLLNGG